MSTGQKITFGGSKAGTSSNVNPIDYRFASGDNVQGVSVPYQGQSTNVYGATTSGYPVYQENAVYRDQNTTPVYTGNFNTSAARFDNNPTYPSGYNYAQSPVVGGQSTKITFGGKPHTEIYTPIQQTTYAQPLQTYKQPTEIQTITSQPIREETRYEQRVEPVAAQQKQEYTSSVPAPVVERKKKTKKGGCPSWLWILIGVLVLAALIVGLVYLFGGFGGAAAATAAGVKPVANGTSTATVQSNATTTNATTTTTANTTTATIANATTATTTANATTATTVTEPTNTTTVTEPTNTTTANTTTATTVTEPTTTTTVTDTTTQPTITTTDVTTQPTTTDINVQPTATTTDTTTTTGTTYVTPTDTTYYPTTTDTTYYPTTTDTTTPVYTPVDTTPVYAPVDTTPVSVYTPVDTTPVYTPVDTTPVYTPVDTTPVSTSVDFTPVATTYDDAVEPSFFGPTPTATTNTDSYAYPTNYPTTTSYDATPTTYYTSPTTDYSTSPSVEYVSAQGPQPTF